MDNKRTGLCHCGMVSFEVNSAPRVIVNCHCDECKKRNGSAFSTYVAVPDNSLKILSGQDLVHRYTVDSVGEKYFCSACGSPIYNINYRIPGACLVFYGAFSEPAIHPPSVNVYCSSKHLWIDSIGTLKSFPEGIER